MKRFPKPKNDTHRLPFSKRRLAEAILLPDMAVEGYHQQSSQSSLGVDGSISEALKSVGIFPLKTVKVSVILGNK